MQLTIPVDEDLLRCLAEEANRTQRPLDEVARTALRTGLRQQLHAPSSVGYESPTFSMGLPLVEGLEKALALSAALEDEDRARSLGFSQSL